MRTFLTAVLVGLCLLFFIRPAAAFKDSEAREELEVLRNQLNQVESSLQVRQMGLGEQLQALREDIARLESKITENHRYSEILNKQLEVDRIEVRESFLQFNRSTEKRFEVADENTRRLLKGIEDLQGNLRTVSDNLRAMSDFEKKQEERITQLQSSLQNQLNVVVEEVGRENLRLQTELAEINKDVFRFQELINTVDGEIRRLAAKIEAVARRQETMARRQEKPADSSPSSSGGTHTVQRGETLSIIAGQYGVTVEGIMDANQISNANLIREGQTLVIPGQ